MGTHKELIEQLELEKNKLAYFILLFNNLQAFCIIHHKHGCSQFYTNECTCGARTASKNFYSEMAKWEESR